MTNKVMRQRGVDTLMTEEPDDRVGHVRIWCATSAREGDREFLSTVCNYTGDGGRPSEVGLQGRASNHRELRGSRARVVSVTEKARLRSRQVGDRKTNASEPLRTCRKLEA